MRLIDKDKTKKLIDNGFISTSDDLEYLDEVQAIPIDWLHKELIELLYKGELGSEQMTVYHRLIKRWKDENLQLS